MGLQPIAIENELSKADALFMEKLHQTIIDHLDNPQLDIPYLCNLIGISRASLYNKLKAIADMGANDYINKIRIERAMQLIKETNLNFTEISEKWASPLPATSARCSNNIRGKRRHSSRKNNGREEGVSEGGESQIPLF